MVGFLFNSWMRQISTNYKIMRCREKMYNINPNKELKKYIVIISNSSSNTSNNFKYGIKDKFSQKKYGWKEQ